eukprot:scaffold15034_cov181-Amphora_coffeaeformis.AAC.9
MVASSLPPTIYTIPSHPVSLCVGGKDPPLDPTQGNWNSPSPRTTATWWNPQGMERQRELTNSEVFRCNYNAMGARQLIRQRHETTIPGKATMWAVWVVLSLSAATAFQPNLGVRSGVVTFPKQRTFRRDPLNIWRDHAPTLDTSFRLSPLSAVTDPEVLMNHFQDDKEWTDADRERIELLYALASAENELDLVNAAAEASVNRPTRSVTVRRKKATKKMEDLSTSDDEQSAEGSSNKVQFRGLSTTGFKGRHRRTRDGTVKSKRSSTMPGFAAESGRQRARREALRLVEKNTGRKIVETTKIRKKRRKENGEAMYRNSASVPDSMVQFADEIHNEDRISRQEEIELGSKTQEAVRLQLLYDSLEEKLDREPTDEEWCAAAGRINMEAIRQAIEEGLEAKNKLVTSNLRLVQSVVNTYIRNGLSAQYNAGDMMQDGIVALIRAAEKFEPDRGWKFSTYAMYWVRASVKRNQVAQSRIVNVPHRLYEDHKRLMKIDRELMGSLDRRPTLKELAKASGMTEQQVERCLTAMAQRCFSLDQEITNSMKPMTAQTQRGRLLDILDTKSEDNDEKKLNSVFLREDLIETLRRHLTEDEVELLLLRYGLKELPQSNTRVGSQPTIAELSRVLDMKPDKVRRLINRALKQLRTSSTDEWRSFQRELY